MSDIDFASQPPEQLDEGLPAGFAHHDHEDGQQDEAAAPTGMQALQQKAPKEAGGVGPHEGLLATATLIGMARHNMPGLDPVDSPTGLMSLLHGPVHNEPQSSDSQSYGMDLSRNNVAGGNVAGSKTAIGNAGGAVRGMAQTDSVNSAMAAVGNLSNALGSGVAQQLSEAGKQAQGHMAWLGHGAKEIYKTRRQ